MNNIIAQGAEAVLYDTGKSILKERPEKKYRIRAIDDKLRSSRTRREAKVMQKLKDAGISVPEILKVDGNSIEMEKVEGKKLRDVLEEFPEEYAKQFGEIVGRVHSLGIVHGDLTTSNVMVNNKKLVLIDFGLSSFSAKNEDRAVDLHVLHQALESKHHEICSVVINEFLKSYEKDFPEGKAVLERLEVVKTRGRYKRKK